ncbi:MAG: hypothetical protein WBM69_20365 [Desulfobacterales bacterium]
MGKPRQKQLRSPLPESPLLSESGLAFFASYPIWIVAAVWLGVRGYTLWGLSPNYYVESYFAMAGDWLSGFTPYSDFQVAYPPGALLLFVLPRIFTEAPIVYGYGFAAVMLVADVSILLILGRIVARVAAGEVTADRARRYQSTLVCLSYVLFTAVFGRLLYQGYDLLMGLLLAASIYLALRQKAAMVDVLAAVAIWLNLTALIWIPMLWWYGFVSRDEQPTSEGSLGISGFIRALLPRAAVLAGSLGVLFLPFLVLSGRSLGYMVSSHLEGGIQLESTAAGIAMVAAKVFGFELASEFTQRAMHLSGSLSSRAAMVCTLLSIMVFVTMTLYLARKMYFQGQASRHGEWLIGGLLATILALLASSPVFLAQTLLWVCPLAAVLAHNKEPRISRIGWQLLGVNLLSVVVFFFFYPDLIELQLLPALLLLIRNVWVIWLVLSVLLSGRAGADERAPRVRITPHTRKYLIYAPVVLLFAWGVIAAFCPVSSNDLWLLLREASYIVASGEIPRVDQYSAVAAGRPYLAHEWLSGLVFLGIFKLGGGEALTVFRALIMLVMLLLLWFSLEQRARSFVLTAPLLALAAYTILLRVFVRPHVFTLLFLCIWVFCLERWRRRRRLGYLIVLVPLQILWANLHGGYMIALVLGVLMTGTAAFLVMFPSWSKDESYAWPDVLKLAGLTVACLGASLVNPHGLRLVEFSLTMGLASDYIKQVVFEWGSPLGPNYVRSYGRVVIFFLFGLVWLGLVLTVRRRPLLDAVLALLATVMTVQAIRFIAFIGILGFPIMVRAWMAVADTHARPLLVKRRPWLEAALFALILASTLIYGFPYGETKHRKVGWGLGGRMPYRVTRFIAEQGFEGTIYNDYGDGAFLIYYLYPRIRPVMDSRIDLYGSQLSYEYFASRDDPIKFFQYLNKYKVSYILLRKSQENAKILDYLVYLAATASLLETDDRLLFSYDPRRLPPELILPKAP